MKKIKFFAAALGLLTFAACSNSDDVFTGSEDLAAEALQDNAITFGTYMGQQAQTRGGHAGAMTTDILKYYSSANGEDVGFGVFAYWTGESGDQDYEAKNGASSTLAPNFMYNQKVLWNGTKWDYQPVKFWPNDITNSAVDNPSPTATGSDTYGGKVSFFAYAPYYSGAADTKGITGFSDRTATGDPIVHYTLATNQSEIVDLLWGTCGNTTTTNVVGTTNGGVTSAASTYVTTPIDPRSTWKEDILKGYTMNADFTKQLTQGQVKFAFKHALAKVGGNESGNGLKIIVDVDAEDGSVTGGTLPSATKVTVKQISIKARSKNSADKYLKNTGAKGDLNLATGKWTLTGEVTDTKTDAAEVSYTLPGAGSTLNTSIADVTSPANWAAIPEGVLTTAKNVFATEAQPLVFIPGTKPELDVEIEYVVYTQDAELSAGWSKVTQKIKRTVEFGSAVQLNKFYNVTLHLGLTSVKFDATVDAWDAGDVGGASSEGVVVNLPVNVKTVAP